MQCREGYSFWINEGLEIVFFLEIREVEKHEEKVPRGREGTMILVDWGFAGFTGSHSGLEPISGRVFLELQLPSGILSHGTPLGREITNVLTEH